MFGAVLRAAGTFAGGMLLITAVVEILGELVPQMEDGLGANSDVVGYFTAVENNLVLVLLLGVVVLVIARAVVESQLGGFG